MKKEKMRDLLCYALEKLIILKKINLDSVNEQVDEGYIVVDIQGKRSVINWREIAYDQLSLSIWWGCNSDENLSSLTKPLGIKKGNVDVCCSCWVERKGGKWIQGYGSDFIVKTYCAKDAYNELMNIPTANPSLFNKEGKKY